MWNPLPDSWFKFIPNSELKEWSQLNTKDLVSFHYSEFNNFYKESICWNNHCAGKSNTEIRFRLDGETMTAYLHRFGM